MRLGKTLALASAIVACSGAFAAEGKRTRYLIPDLEYGLEAFTGYNSNVNASTDEQESFMITVRPFLKYERDFAFGPLSLAYEPEMRWYENRDGDSTEWDHVVSAGTTLTLTPTMTLALNDTFSEISRDDVTEIDGVTVGGNNDYIRNLFKADYEWDFAEGQQFLVGYTNTFIEYDDEDNAYRNVRSNEAYLGYKRNVARDVKLGAKLVYGMSNFYDSETDEFGGINTDRDSEWTRFLVTSEVYSGPWRFTADFGADYYRATSDVVPGVDKSEMDPYLKAKVDYFFTSKNVAAMEYVYRIIPGYKEDVFFAKQSKVRFSYKHTFNERLKFNAQVAYDNVFYDDKFSRDGEFGDDHDEWLRTGFDFTYQWLQNVDIMMGISHDRLINATEDQDEYTVNKYNVGLLYEF